MGSSAPPACGCELLLSHGDLLQGHSVRKPDALPTRLAYNTSDRQLSWGGGSSKATPVYLLAGPENGRIMKEKNSLGKRRKRRRERDD